MQFKVNSFIVRFPDDKLPADYGLPNLTLIEHRCPICQFLWCILNFRKPICLRAFQTSQCDPVGTQEWGTYSLLNICLMFWDISTLWLWPAFPASLAAKVRACDSDCGNRLKEVSLEVSTKRGAILKSDQKSQKAITRLSRVAMSCPSCWIPCTSSRVWERC